MKINGFRLSRLIILLIFTKILVSCTPEACLEETTSFLNASFYRVATYKLTAPDSITVFGIGKEANKLYSNSLGVTTITLPLDASADSCGFVLKINDVTDTLRFTYSSYPHLISKECGITFFYSLDTCRISGTIIDTIIVRNKNITTFNEENIRILY
jgi:hypothetical protein